MATLQTDVISCKFTVGYIAKTFNGLPISDLANVHTCNYDSGYCFDQQKGIAVKFTPDPQVHQRYVMVGEYNGTLISGHVLVPEIGLSFNFQKEIDLPAVKEIDGFRVSISQHQEDNVPVVSGVEDIQPLLDELTHKLQYLEDSVLLRTAKVTNLCEALQLINVLVRAAATKNPTQILRHQFNKTGIIGVAASNDYILMGHCKSVKASFRRPDTNICTDLIPVTYQLNEELMTGYLSPADGVLHNIAARVSCNTSNVQLFTHEGSVYKYLPGHIPERLHEHLAVPLPLFVTNFTNELVTIPSTWVTSNEDVSHTTQSEAAVTYLTNELTDLQERYSNSKSANHDTLHGLAFAGLKSLYSGHIFDLLLT